MEMTITQKPGAIAVLHLTGTLDGSNFRSLITEAQKLYESGVRNLVLDLSGLTFMSSAGISALHRVALVFRDEAQAPQEEEGWAAYRAIGRDRESGLQKHVKLVNPSERVQHALDLVGFASFFEVYTDAEVAAASFQQAH